LLGQAGFVEAKIDGEDISVGDGQRIKRLGLSSQGRRQNRVDGVVD